jgi:hypothetical protein
LALQREQNWVADKMISLVPDSIMSILKMDLLVMLLEKAKDLSWEQEVKKTNQAQEIIKQNQPLEVKEFQFLVESWKEMVP